MSGTDLFDISLLKKKIYRAKKYADFDQLLYRLAAENISETIASYNRNFETVLDLSFLPQKTISSISNIDHLTILSDIFDNTLLENKEGKKEKKYDLIISNLSIQSINNITSYLTNIRSLLKDDGIFIGSLFGNQTLHELKHVSILTESALGIAHSSNVIPLLDIQKIGNLLQRVAFKMPVIDSNIYTFEYKNIYDLCLELKKMGLTNHMYKRRINFLGKKYWPALNEIYLQHYPASTRLQSSFEILNFTSVK